MIVIQIILIALLLAIAVNFIGSRNSHRTRAIKKILLVLTIPCAIFVVLFPYSSTRLANALGVGRGADLLLYGLAIMVIFQVFDTYIKSKEEQKRIVAMGRRIAILEARLETLEKKAGKRP